MESRGARVNEVRATTQTTRKALRVYEEQGLVTPAREANGYRRYSEQDVRVVAEIRQLNQLGIPLKYMRPFVDCLHAGGDEPDSCPASLTEYRRAIERIDDTVATLTDRRRALVANLSVASRRLLESVRDADAANPNLRLPSGLPEPEDDGAADHLAGATMPSLPLPSTDGTEVDLGAVNRGRVLVYVFPMTGAPETDMPDGWDAIPGARGCSPHNCDMRDHFADLVRAGADAVYGLSSQPRDYQEQLTRTLRLPYPLLTDDELRLAMDPGLPTFTAAGLTLFRRMALVITDAVVEHVFYPVFPPDRHAEAVLDWLGKHPRTA